MGEARLRKLQERPEHPAGPRGHTYYCNDRCGTPVFRKDTNSIFIQRNHPLWGLCKACATKRMEIAAAQALTAICKESKTQVEVLRKSSNVQLLDGKGYNLSVAASSMPEFKELPTGVEIGTVQMKGRCATMFRHMAHDHCDGNPDGLIDPAMPA